MLTCSKCNGPLEHQGDGTADCLMCGRNHFTDMEARLLHDIEVLDRAATRAINRQRFWRTAPLSWRYHAAT